MKLRRIYTWINRIIGILVILMVVGGVAFYFWIHSERGMDWLADRVAHATDDRVIVRNLRGELPFYLTAGYVEWRDEELNRLAAASNLHARISVRAMTKRSLIIRDISADHVRLENLPRRKTREATAHPEASERTAKTRIPLHEGILESLLIRNFHIGTNVFGHEVEGNLSGKFAWRNDGAMSATLRTEIIIDQKIPVSAKFKGDYNARQDILTVSPASITNTWDTLSATLVYQIERGTINAEFDLQTEDLSRYNSLHNTELSGAASIRASISRINDNHPIQVYFNAASPLLEYDAITAGVFSVNGTMAIDGEDAEYEVGISAQSIQAGNWVLDQPSINSKGTRQNHETHVATSGAFTDAHSFELGVRLNIAIGDEDRQYQFTAHTMTGRWNSLHFSWLEPAFFEMRDNKATASIRNADFNQAGVSLDVEMTDWKLNTIKADIHSLDLAGLNIATDTNAPAVAGTASLTADLRNLTATPTGTARLNAEGVTIHYGFLHHFEQSNLELNARLAADELIFDGKVTHPLLDRFETLATVQIVATNQFFPLTFKRENGFDLRVRLEGNLREISETMLTRPMALGGYVSMDLAAEGFPHKPTLDGYLWLTNGQFRSLETGTFLDKIDVRLIGQDNKLKLTHATAGDGGRGRVAALGEISFEPDWQADWLFNATITNATLFRFIRTDLPLSGNILGIGNREIRRIEGSLWLEPFKFVIPRRLPPSIRELDVVEINHPDPSRNTVINNEPREEREPRERSRPIDFDIRLTTRRGFEVTGRGLQSEWRGNLHLTGNSDKPQLIGSVRVARGYTMLLGRRFNIDEGRIDLTGPVPPNPSLYISASTRISDVTASLVAVGTVNRPDIRLISDPMLPEDEIMAVILFGKSLETMTPWQAIALANGLRILGGGEDVVGVMEGTQNLMRVDQIDIRQDEEGEGFSSVVVGKYIGRNLYVEGEKGFGEAEDSITVTLELTPRLILETETSPRIREGVSLFWRREF